MESKNIKKIITIDGLASSGKSTLASLLSQKIKWPFFSTGVLYRGMAYVKDLEKMSDEETLKFFKSDKWRLDLQEKSLFFYKDEDISSKLYSAKMDEISSLFSAKAPLRRALIPYQREFYKEEKVLF